MSWRSFYDKHMTRMMFWRKVVVFPFIWSRRDFISPRYPCEQVLQSSGFRLNIWNWLCFSLSVHVMISATASNALCKLQLQKNDAFTVAPTTEWHDCLARISVREMPKLYILTYYLYFVYREENLFPIHIGAWVSEFEHHFQQYMWWHIDVQANRRRRWTYGQAPTP